MWALAKKAKLGNSYHLVRDNEMTALCSKAIALEEGSQTENPGTTMYPGSVCGRCQNLQWQKSRL